MPATPGQIQSQVPGVSSCKKRQGVTHPSSVRSADVLCFQPVHLAVLLVERLHHNAERDPQFETRT